MKPTAYLINTGRAGLIDQDALERALAERKIAGAGLDVFPTEPLPAESKLRELDNVTLTTHIAGTTTEALTNSPFLLMEDIARLFRDGTPRFLVNPEVLDRPECAMWLQQHAPDVLRACSRLLGVQDYVAYLMTGSYCTDYSQASRTLLFDINGLRWDCEILRELEVPLNKLPDAVEPGARIGATTAALRRETGSPSGVPVVLAGGDQQLAAVGMGLP